MSPGRVSFLLSIALHLGLWITLDRGSTHTRAQPLASEVPIALVVQTVQAPTEESVEPLPFSPLPSERPAPRVRPRSRRRQAEPGSIPSSPVSPETDGEGVSSTEGNDSEGVFGPGQPPDSIDLQLRPEIPPPDWVAPVSPPPPPALDYELRPSSGGGYVIHDRQVWAEIHRDGGITFHDQPPIQWKRRDRGENSAKAKSILPTRLDPPGVSLAFAVDLNDAVFRALGDDPYGGIKRDILRKTRELRLKLSEEACKEDLRESILALRGRLEGIWSDAHWSAEVRRERLFALWDECLEEGSGTRVEHGRMARNTIIAFIQRHLPPTSADAYSPEELELLNRHRHSQARFEPYGPHGSL